MSRRVRVGLAGLLLSALVLTLCNALQNSAAALAPTAPATLLDALERAPGGPTILPSRPASHP